MKMFAVSFGLLLATTAVAEAPEHGSAPAPDAAAEPAAADPGASAIIVTGTRIVTTIDRVPFAVTVLDKTAIDRAQDIGVSELLLRTPSISMYRNGGYGTATSLRIRGAEPEQTVAVIDGVKLNDPASTGGGYNFANLLVGDIERVEVLRGPQSTLWGSQAIGGVVNIVTALPTRPLEASFDVEAGSRQTVNARIGVGGKTGPVTWRLGATAFTTDGISAIAPAYGGRESDPYVNKTVTGRVEIALASNLGVDLRGYYANGRTDIDATTGDSAEFTMNREFVGYAGVNLALFGGRFRNRLGFAYTDTNRDNYNPTLARAQTFSSAGRNHRLEYQGSVAIAKGWDATFGVDREVSDFRSVSPPSSLAVPVPAPARGRARLMGAYAQLAATIVDGLTLTGGIRRDDHSTAGGKTLVQGGATWVLATGTILRASYGQGFKAPSLFQLYSIYGNTTLAPEQARGWEAGADQTLFGGKLQFGATYYRRRSQNLIIFNSCPAVSALPLCFQPGTTISRIGYYQNVSRALGRGLELTGAAHPIAGLTIDGNYSWNLAEDRSIGSATYGKWLPRRPRKEANGSISYDWPFGLTTGAAIRWAGHSFDNASNLQRLDSYTLVDLRTEYKLSERLRLFARVENLFDKNYMTAFRFGTLGRSVYAGLRGRF
jgi:vitamin B12 transporter